MGWLKKLSKVFGIRERYPSEVEVLSVFPDARSLKVNVTRRGRPGPGATEAVEKVEMWEIHLRLGNLAGIWGSADTEEGAWDEAADRLRRVGKLGGDDGASGTLPPPEAGGG